MSDDDTPFEKLIQELKTVKIPKIPQDTVLLGFPILIANFKSDLEVRNSQIATVEIELSSTRYFFVREVDKLCNGDGKYPPHLSTLKAREVEAKLRTRNSPEYIHAKEHLKALEKKKANLLILIELAENIYKSARYIERRQWKDEV